MIELPVILGNTNRHIITIMMCRLKYTLSIKQVVFKRYGKECSGNLPLARGTTQLFFEQIPG